MHLQKLLYLALDEIEGLKMLKSITPVRFKERSSWTNWLENVDVSLVREGVAVFVLLLVGLAVVQYAAPGLAGNDGYYHIKMGYLIRTEGLTPTFDFLPFTILNESAYYDHHLLFHVWLALFATVDPAVDGGIALTQAAKLASVLMAGLAFLSVWWLLKQEKVPFAAVWTVALLAISEAFLYRMSMPRAQSMSLLLLVWGIYWVLREKHMHLLALGVVFVWAYNAFPLLIVVAVVYLIATMMLERRFVWQTAVYPTIGILLGLLINPYFPQNIDFIVGHLAPKLGESATKVGNEWSPYQTWTLVQNSAGTWILLLTGILAISWQEKRIDKRTLFSLGMVVLFGYMLFESRRFVEYFPPMVLIFAAFATAPIVSAKLAEPFFRQAWVRMGLTAVCFLLLIYPIHRTLQGGADLVADSKPADLYTDAMQWLTANAPAGSQIFQTDWDDFTRLFFYNSDVTYTAGLDPTFMELQDPALFDAWVDITQGRVDNPSQQIREQFNATFIFSDLKHTSFLEVAEQDPSLVEVFRDEYGVVFHVKE